DHRARPHSPAAGEWRPLCRYGDPPAGGRGGARKTRVGRRRGRRAQPQSAGAGRGRSADRQGALRPADRTRRRGGMTMSVLASIRSQLAPVHREGLLFVGIFAVVSLLAFWLSPPLGWLGFVATLWCAYFFRDPARVTPLREGIVVAPADGRVSRVVEAMPPKELGLGERPLPRVSIFMSVFDCHINRSPLAGKIERIIYHAGA